MQVRHIPREFPSLPEPVGAHSLAWSYLLDAVCADAYHAGVLQLDIALPSSFEREIQARAPFLGAATPAAGGKGAAMVSLNFAPPTAGASVRHYRLRFGALAPAPLRAATAPPSGNGSAIFDRTACLYVYTLRTRLLGIPMRLLNLLDRPRPADRALIALRHAFASTRPTPSYYLLETWVRSEQKS